MPNLSRRFVLGGLAALAAHPAQAEPDVWPAADMIDQTGAVFQLGSSAQRLTVVHVWAHWCAPCLAELPSLAALAGRLPASGTGVLLVSHPQNWAADVAYAQRKQLPFRLATLAPGAPAWVRPALFEEHAGRYTVPRTLLFRRADQSMQTAVLKWDSPAALQRLGELAG